MGKNSNNRRWGLVVDCDVDWVRSFTNTERIDSNNLADNINRFQNKREMKTDITCILYVFDGSTATFVSPVNDSATSDLSRPVC